MGCGVARGTGGWGFSFFFFLFPFPVYHGFLFWSSVLFGSFLRLGNFSQGVVRFGGVCEVWVSWVFAVSVVFCVLWL